MAYLYWDEMLHVLSQCLDKLLQLGILCLLLLQGLLPGCHRSGLLDDLLLPARHTHNPTGSASTWHAQVIQY